MLLVPRLVRATSWMGAAALAATLLSAPPALSSPAAPAAAVEPPTGGAVLISEIANGGGGADTDAARVSADNFIEVGNFGSEPVDISGWRLLRCGQTGDAYGPQKLFPEGTVLAPGDTYTVAGPTADQAKIPRDSLYDATGANLHEFGYGAWLETSDFEVVDRVGFYHRSVFSDCGQDDQALERPLDYRLNQSHQRIGSSGDPEADWIVASRTPDAGNSTEPAPGRSPGPMKITEVALGSPISDNDQYVELTNTGTEPVDVTGWKLFRCGENGSAYVQNPSLPAGSVVTPGASYVIAHASASADIPHQATYATGMHWRDFGAMLVNPADRVVDGVGFYENRNSICTTGKPETENLDAQQAESYHRLEETGNNAGDFMLAQERSPGLDSPGAQLTAPAPLRRRDLRISELIGAGPAGNSDEFIEIGNYGSEPINLAGYSLVRCEGTGKANAGAQVADLGPVTLAPGEAYLAVDDSAPVALREQADALYVTGLNEAEGYGAYLRDPAGDLVDAVGVYETVDYSPCVAAGSELRNYTKTDQGESYQRARTTGDNEEDFMRTPGRTPGEMAQVEWIDPTEPMPGELDPVQHSTRTPPATPQLRTTGSGESRSAEVTTRDADGGDLDVQVRSATPAATDGTTITVGSTLRRVPTTLRVTGERLVATAPALTTRAGGSAFPFQRYAIPVADAASTGWEFTWTGSTRDRNEVQIYVWNSERWVLRDAGTPSADDGLTLVAGLDPADAIDGQLGVLVIDGPRTEGGAVEEIGVTDQAFLDPWQYDFAFNHMSDTQFLSEGFRDVYRRMTTWVAANSKARKIGYSTNSGDIIENWIGGNADPVRARKEFAAAKRIQQLLNDAGVPNGVLPGNHDNLWGRDNRLYNEYFGPQMYAGKPWWGDSWRPGDNSAHYDFVEAAGLELLMLSLPYRPSQAQIDWAREVAASYPQHNVVLNTHSYLNTEKEIENRDSRYTARGEDIWSDLVAPSDNIFLVLGGHYHGVATKYGDPVTGEQSDAIEIAEDAVEVRNVGETGRVVVQMLADYQGYRSTQPTPRGDTLDRDTGFQRLLQMDFDAELMAANSYSPHLESFEAWRYDEPDYRGDNARYTAKDDEFVAKIDLLVPKSVQTTAWSLTGTSTLAGETTAAAGATARVPLDGLSQDSVIYATVTDATGLRVVSAPTRLGPGSPAAGTTLTASPATQAYGAPAARRVVLTAQVRSGDGIATGTVEFREGTRVLGRATVAAERASYRLPATLAVGAHVITARYLTTSSTGTGSTSTPVRVTVTRATSTVRARLADPRISPRQRTRARISVRAPGVSAIGVGPTGVVQVSLRGNGTSRTVRGRLDASGRVVVRLPAVRRGDYRVRARYAGSALAAPGRSSVLTLRVR